MYAASESVIIHCIASGAIVKGQAVKVAGQSGGVFTASVCADPTHLFYGIALESVADGKRFAVCIAGKCEAIANGAITAGTHKLLSCTTDGELEPYAVGDIPVAVFLGSKKGSATAAANDLIDVLVIHGPIDTIV